MNSSYKEKIRAAAAAAADELIQKAEEAEARQDAPVVEVKSVKVWLVANAVEKTTPDFNSTANITVDRQVEP